MPLIRSRSVPDRSHDLRPADRARTVLATAPTLQVGTVVTTDDVGRHAVLPDGSLLFVAPPDSPASVCRVAPRLPSPPVSTTAVDLSPVPQPDRVRGRVHVTGRLGLAPDDLPAGARRHLTGGDPHAGPVLQLVPERVTLVSPDGGTEVALDAYRQAGIDPLVDHEARWLPHLHADHPALVRALAEQVVGRLAAEVRVVPLAVDRHGLTLRVHRHDGGHDVHLDWPEPIGCGCELRPAMAALVESLGIVDRQG